MLSKTGQFEESYDFVERALYRLELSCHSQFSLTLPTTRLSYNIPSNRSLFLALWRYSQNVGRQGSVHTAFEMCKLLLKLSPNNDPLCTLLVLDYRALRCFDYLWIIKMAKYFIVQKNNIRILPNWAFSCALAMFLWEKKINKGLRPTSLLPPPL